MLSQSENLIQDQIKLRELELKEKEFTLTINGNSEKITMGKAEIVSVVYDNGKFTICHDTIPV